MSDPSSLPWYVLMMVIIVGVLCVLGLIALVLKIVECVSSARDDLRGRYLGGGWEPAGRIRTQQRNDKNKLYPLRAPAVECLAEGKARRQRCKRRGIYLWN